MGAAVAVEELRRHVRHRALKAGRIIFRQGGSTMDCTVKNISESGARILVDQAIIIPEQFELQFLDGSRHACTVRWRKLTQIGVHFED
jgi:hypothetical protein